MTISSKLLTLADYKAAQYTAIIGKGGTVTQADWGAYAAAIDALPSGSGAYVPAQVLNMPFTAGDEPTGGTVWYVKPDGAGLKDGTSWSNAFATRQEAVNAASAGDRVYVWEGTYYLEAVQTPKAGVSEYYGFNDDGSWAKRQPFTHPSKHDAGFTVNNFSNAAYIFLDEQIIDGLWIQNAVASSGIYCTQKTVLRNCVVTNCTSTSYGGGMYLYNSSTATNCVVTNCTANSHGGGMYLQSSSTAANCVVTNCTASQGGGMYMSGSGTAAANCVVTNCTATSYGGGMSVSGGSTAANCVVTNCTTSYGGGMYLNSSSTAANCVVTNCTGASYGGGMSVANSSTATNCTVILCSAPTGSGFWVGSNSQRLYNCCSWGCNIYLGQANYAYKIYNCASNFALTGVTNWDTNADVQNFLPLSTFPFAAAGVAPFDGNGAYFQNLNRSEEALAFIDRVVMAKQTDPHLPAGSALIGAGYYEAGVTPDTDADGKARPLTPSIGAYEP